MVALQVSLKGKPTINVDFSGKHPDDVTVKELKNAVQAKFPKMVRNRQRLTLPVDSGKPIPLVDESKSIGSYGVKDGAKLRLKDLGRQVEYKWMYLWEYIGPIILNPLFLHYSHLLWGPYPYSNLQIAVRNVTILHFAKRFFESLLIHSPSPNRPTLPLLYVFRNCLYYWGVNGLLMGLTLYRPAYSQTALRGSILNTTEWIGFWALVMLVGEILNFNSHLHLASLRVAPGKPRKYPTGFGFGSVVCANYFFETLTVIATVVMTGFDFGAIVYFCIGEYFMFRWSGQKYARYKKEMDPKVFPGKRWKMFPFVY